MVWGAPQAAESPKLSGFTASSDGGVEGTQFIQYDENGQVLGGNVTPVPRSTAMPAPAKVFGRTEASAPNVAAGPSANEGTAGRKMVDPSVDFNSALKKVTKTNPLTEQRYEMKQAELGKDTVYSRENILTFDTWHGKYDTFGRKKAEVEVADTFERGVVRDKTMFEVKAVERPEVTRSIERSEMKGLDERFTTEKNSRYDVTPQPASERLAPKPLNELSMQDLNRYQFRRNRSDEPGLPYVKPGSDEVKTQGAAGQ